jgi:hypothetical protein
MERRTVTVLSAFLLLAVAPQPPPEGSPVIAAAYSRNDSLQSYTFEVDVAMAMRHFPWLHFHIQGDGVYERGRRYVVHFTKMPFFAPQPRDVDLSMLDPAMWPGLYTFEAAPSENGNDTIFTLHSIKDESLEEALVTMSPLAGTERVDATYHDGTHIAMTVASNDSDGYLLPTKITAKIDYGSTPLSADADFTHYVLP